METLVCSVCASEWSRQQKPGRKPDRCPDCQFRSPAERTRAYHAAQRQVIEPRQCAGCAQAFFVPSSSTRTRCKPCVMVTQWDKTCRYCDKTFLAASARAVVCYARECQAQKHRDRVNAFYRSYREQHGVSYAYAKYPEQRKAYRDWRNVKRRGATSGKAINRKDIYERDGWTCGLCFGQINPELKFPHPDSASVDHIVPISKGGAHTLENVQAAHLTCNTSRQDKPMQDFQQAA